MSAKFTVFGQLAEKGKGVEVWFDHNGHVVSSQETAVALVRFEIDEDGDPVGYVQYNVDGIEYFDHELLYFGSFADAKTTRSSLACFKGRLVLCIRRERDSESGADHFFLGRAVMRLWLLEVKRFVGEGAISSLVVRAEDEAAARQLAQEKSGEDRGHDYKDDPTTECYLGKGCWLDTERTSVSEIALGAEEVLHVARC
jgi:hypothetical protein